MCKAFKLFDRYNVFLAVFGTFRLNLKTIKLSSSQRPVYRIAYCSNVHAGSSLQETTNNLSRYSVPIKSQFRPHSAMGVGLWLSNQTAAELVASNAATESLNGFLVDEGLEVFTFNGFPFGNFHQAVVKHAVYTPTWFEKERATYTKHLAKLINCFASEGDEASISTLPIAWGSPAPSANELNGAAKLLGDVAEFLSELEKDTGRLVYLCIEPEPGCYIQRATDIVGFFEDHLLPANKMKEAIIRKHIRVCHDVCHSVVMAESQRFAWSTYANAGIKVGKVQISSAVVVDFNAIDTSDRQQAIAELNGFAEDRYLHQTTIQLSDEEPRFFEDLPLALATIDDPKSAEGTWRIHFHVPIYLERFGLLQASQQAIVDCVTECRNTSDVQHFEVETYAWNVLPPELQQADLATGIADELKWFEQIANEHLT